MCVPSSLQPNEYQGFLMNVYIKEVEREVGEEVMLRPKIEFPVIPGEWCGLGRPLAAVLSLLLPL